jgi:hypothetical protein
MAINYEFEFTKVELDDVQKILNGILKDGDSLLATLKNICGTPGTEKADACYRALRLEICGKLEDIEGLRKTIRAKRPIDAALKVRVLKYGVMNSTWSREKKAKAKAKATKVESAIVFAPWTREDCNAMIGVINSNPEVYKDDSGELIAALQVLATKLPEQKKAAKKKAAKKKAAKK